MKNPIQNTALLAACVSIIGKMIYHLFMPHDLYWVSSLFYLLTLTFALFVGLRYWKMSNQLKFTDDIKAGLKIGSLYALIIGAFTYVYYALVNPDFFDAMIAQRVEAARTSDVSPEQIEQVEQTAQAFFSPFFHSTLTLFGFMVIGFFYTIVIVLLFRWRPQAFGIRS